MPRRRSSRSYASILRADTATIPNAILLLFGVLTVTFGSWRDALFLGIRVSNIAVGAVLASKLIEMDPHHPTVDTSKCLELEAAKTQLEAETASR